MRKTFGTCLGVLFFGGLLLVLPTAALGERLKLDVTYTNGQIVSGPLSADLTELPPSVDALFVLNGTGAGTYSISDVLRSSLVFGDGSWNAADLDEFSATLEAGGGGLAVIALSYKYGPKDTPTTLDKLAANFPLDIRGTDIASGQEYHYRYATSSETVTEVPEPASVVLGVLGILAVVAVVYRRRSAQQP